VDPLVQEVCPRTEAEGNLISWCSLLFGSLPHCPGCSHHAVVPSCNVECLSFHPFVQLTVHEMY
jgi:hypothetical protein